MKIDNFKKQTEIEDALKNKDNRKNDDDPKNEDNIKMETFSKWRHSQNDAPSKMKTI